MHLKKRNGRNAMNSYIISSIRQRRRFTHPKVERTNHHESPFLLLFLPVVSLFLAVYGLFLSFFLLFLGCFLGSSNRFWARGFKKVGGFFEVGALKN